MILLHDGCLSCLGNLTVNIALRADGEGETKMHLYGLGRCAMIETICFATPPAQVPHSTGLDFHTFRGP
jgi:hypothetical protein